MVEFVGSSARGRRANWSEDTDMGMKISRARVRAQQCLAMRNKRAPGRPLSWQLSLLLSDTIHLSACARTASELDAALVILGRVWAIPKASRVNSRPITPGFLRSRPWDKRNAHSGGVGSG